MRKLLDAVEEVTGLTLRVDFERRVFQVFDGDTKLWGSLYKTDAELIKHIYKVLFDDSRKQLALWRLVHAQERGDSWDEWFHAALENGWEPEELMETAEIPTVTNVRKV
jgi:hypothetical protein